jgi:integrase
MFCGLRRGELLALQWSDIRFKTGEITIRHSLEERKKEKVLKTPKNGKTRVVYMTDGVVTILKQHRKRQLEFQMLLGKQYHKSSFVIVEDDGKQPAPSYASRFFARRITRSKLPRVRFHDLRHTAASLMLLEGVNLKTVSEILGHSGISITADIYSHVIKEAKKQAADSLEKYIKKE